MKICFVTMFIILLSFFDIKAQECIKVAFTCEYKLDVLNERLSKPEGKQQEEVNRFLENYYKEQQANLNNSEITLLADGKQYKLTYISPMPSDRNYISSFNSAVGFFGARLIYGDIKNKTTYLAGTKGSVEIDRVFYLNEVEWELTNETKTILGYTCYKAVGHLKEKNLGNYRQFPVTAWYAPELSYQGGPTQYVNLPGLILEFETRISSVKATAIDFGDFKIEPYVPQYKVMTYAKFIQRRDSLDKIYRPRQD